MMHPGDAGTATRLTPESEVKAGGLTTALGIGQICSWGSLYYSFPLIAEAMGAEFGWSKSHLYAAATIGLILAALATYSVGVAVDRGQGRWVMGLSSLGAGILLMLWSQIDSLVFFYLLTAGIGLMQAATLYEPAFAVLARRVGAARSRQAITTLTLWGGFASTVFIPLIQWLLDQWGWRGALMVLGLVNVLLCTSLHLMFIRPERDSISTEPGAAGRQIAVDRQAVHTAVRRPVFWALLLALTVYAAMFSAFTFHMYPMFIEHGMATVTVVQTIALIGPAQVAGRVLISVFGARASMRTIGSVVVASFPITFAALFWIDATFWPVAIVCVAYGAANGIFTIVRGLVVPEMLSRHAYGAINGLLTVPNNLARAIAPLAAALLWSTTASYDSVLAGIVALAVVLAASFWLAAWFSRPPVAAGNGADAAH